MAKTLDLALMDPFQSQPIQPITSPLKYWNEFEEARVREEYNTPLLVDMAHIMIDLYDALPHRFALRLSVFNSVFRMGRCVARPLQWRAWNEDL